MKIKFLNGTEKDFASLSCANLRGADLHGADLHGADLRGANLRGANLCDANLCDANLHGADFSGADLHRANLCDANLHGADFSGADLHGADIAKIIQSRTIVGVGTLKVFKKLANGIVAELEIPAKAGRVGGVTGRKCRAEFARVISGEGESQYDSNFFYRVGEMVRPDKWDDNPLVECASGIHFFITREEAEDY